MRLMSSVIVRLAHQLELPVCIACDHACSCDDVFGGYSFRKPTPKLAELACASASYHVGVKLDRSRAKRAMESYNETVVNDVWHAPVIGYDLYFRPVSPTLNVSTLFTKGRRPKALVW